MKKEIIDVQERAAEITHIRITDGFVSVPKVDRGNICALSKPNRTTLAINNPDRTFVGNFKAFIQLASGKMVILLFFI